MEFSITPYSAILDQISKEDKARLSEEEKASWGKLLEYSKTSWQATLVAAKKLKKGDKTNWAVEGIDVRFSDGKLILVAGCGQIVTETADKSE